MKKRDTAKQMRYAYFFRSVPRLSNSAEILFNVLPPRYIHDKNDTLFMNNYTIFSVKIKEKSICRWKFVYFYYQSCSQSVHNAKLYAFLKIPANTAWFCKAFANMDMIEYSHRSGESRMHKVRISKIRHRKVQTEHHPTVGRKLIY